MKRPYPESQTSHAPVCSTQFNARLGLVSTRSKRSESSEPTLTRDSQTSQTAARLATIMIPFTSKVPCRASAKRFGTIVTEWQFNAQSLS